MGSGRAWSGAAFVPFDRDDPVLVAAAWSRLVEPGDRAAGEVVAALGAAPALELVLGGEHLGEPHLDAAVERWRTRVGELDPARDVELIRTLGGIVLHRGDPRWPA
ncbi:MAG: hypothetical protein J0H73_16825, partial [Salana multivorans]|nr:hypothetical protein [Salana multivorans]